MSRLNLTIHIGGCRDTGTLRAISWRHIVKTLKLEELPHFPSSFRASLDDHPDWLVRTPSIGVGPVGVEMVMTGARRPTKRKEAVVLPNTEYPGAELKSEGSVVISVEEFTRLLALMQTMTSTIVELYVWMATAGQRTETSRS